MYSSQRLFFQFHLTTTVDFTSVSQNNDWLIEKSESAIFFFTFKHLNNGAVVHILLWLVGTGCMESTQYKQFPLIQIVKKSAFILLSHSNLFRLSSVQVSSGVFLLVSTFCFTTSGAGHTLCNKQQRRGWKQQWSYRNGGPFSGRYLQW